MMRPGIEPWSPGPLANTLPKEEDEDENEKCDTNVVWLNHQN